MTVRLSWAAVAGVVVAGALLAACSDKNQFVLPAGGDAQSAAGITVAGQGIVQAVPDTGYFSVGVQVTAAKVEDARNGAADAADRLIKSVKGNGVDAKDIQTSNISIQPQYDYSKNGSAPQITGYIVTNTIEVKVRKLDTFSKIIDDAVKAAGDAARLQGVSFGVEDNAKALSQAREAAMKDARTKAEELAKLGGTKLGKPISITEVVSSPPRAIPAASAAGAAKDSVATPIETGTTGVTVQVTVRWAME